MNQSPCQAILERLEDERSKRVVFVSHCLLNENTRYLGGAFRQGYFPSSIGTPPFCRAKDDAAPGGPPDGYTPNE